MTAVVVSAQEVAQETGEDEKCHNSRTDPANYLPCLAHCPSRGGWDQAGVEGAAARSGSFWGVLERSWFWHSCDY